MTLRIDSSTVRRQFEPKQRRRIKAEGYDSGNMLLTISNSTISGNSTMFGGGALYSGTVGTATATVTISNSTSPETRGTSQLRRNLAPRNTILTSLAVTFQ